MIVLVEYRRRLRRERFSSERPGPGEPSEEDDSRLAVVQRPEQRILREAGELVAVLAPDLRRDRAGQVRQRFGGIGREEQEEARRPAVEGHGPAYRRPIRGDPLDQGAPAPRRGRLRDLVQVGVEPADAQLAVGTQSPDVIDVSPDDPRRVPRVEDERERPGGDQLLSLELPPLLLLAPGRLFLPGGIRRLGLACGSGCVCGHVAEGGEAGLSQGGGDRQYAGTREGRQQRARIHLGNHRSLGGGGVTGIDSRRPSGTHGRGGSVYKPGRSPVHSPRAGADARAGRRAGP